MVAQCACSDVTGHRTLAQLRTAMLRRLGFADPLTAAVRSLADLRTDMLRLLGYGAVTASPPPGMAEEMATWLNEAQQTLFRRLELDRGTTAAPARMVADGDLTTLDYQPVFTLAMALACAHRAKPEAKAYFEQHEKYVADTASRRPPGLTAQLNEFLDEAQRTAYARLAKAGVRTERWFTWNLTAGERFYDLPNNLEQTATPACTKLLNPDLVTFVGVQRDSTIMSLLHGIAPQVLAQSLQGWPERYEIRQCIELWPAPDTTAGQLVIKGHFGLSPFTDDAHETTIDDHLVYLLAMGNAKAHYRQPDAGTYISQFEAHLMSVVAASHQTARYIHDDRRRSVYVEPKPSTPFS